MFAILYSSQHIWHSEFWLGGGCDIYIQAMQYLHHLNDFPLFLSFLILRPLNKQEKHKAQFHVYMSHYSPNSASRGKGIGECTSHQGQAQLHLYMVCDSITPDMTSIRIHNVYNTHLPCPTISQLKPFPLQM